MKHEERNPMKYFKSLLRNALVFAMSVVAVVLTLSILGQALAIGMFALVIAFVFGGIAFVLTRRPKD